MGGRALFKKGQRCLVPHTDRYYLAHILRAQKREEGMFYEVHYDGWSKKYDEWVEETGLVKYDESLLPAEERTGGGAGAAAAPKDSAAAGTDAAGVAAAGGGASVRKRKAEGGGMEPVAPVDTTLPLQLRLHMPPLLKKVVLDDHNQITHCHHMQPLPRRPCVRDILQAFEQAKAKEAEGAVDAATREVVSGLQSYFDQGLRQLLLYQQEVQQCEEALGQGKLPSGVYGGEHLVRLLIKLPELMPVAAMGPQNVLMLEGLLSDLMNMMVKEQGKYFLPAEAYIPNPHCPPPLALPPMAPPLVPAAAGPAVPAPPVVAVG